MTKTIPTSTRITQDMAAGGRDASFFLPLAALNLAIRSDGNTAVIGSRSRSDRSLTVAALIEDIV